MIYVGFYGGWYIFREDTEIKNVFENDVIEWLFSSEIAPGVFSHYGNGNEPGISSLDNSVHLFLKRLSDVLAFEKRFACSGLSPDIILESITKAV